MKTRSQLDAAHHHLLALFPQRTQKGRPKLTTRSGFFYIGRKGQLFYSEPHNGVLEYHGTLGETGLDTKEKVAAFIQEFQD
jgi:hypothetical protein